EALLELTHALAAHAEAGRYLGQRRRVLRCEASLEDLDVTARERAAEVADLAVQRLAELVRLRLDVGPQRLLCTHGVAARASVVVPPARRPIERALARRQAALHLDDFLLTDVEGRGQLTGLDDLPIAPLEAGALAAQPEEEPPLGLRRPELDQARVRKD